MSTQVPRPPVDYTIVEGTGSFTGFSGTFHGAGRVEPAADGEVTGKHTTGVIRFEGAIDRG